MNSSYYESLPDFLTKFQITLLNIEQVPAIGLRLALYGYDADRLAEGRALHEELQQLDLAQVEAYGLKEGTFQQLTDGFKTVDARYGWHRNLAKRLWPKGSIGWRALLLNQRKPEQRSAWRRQAQVFYTNLLANAERVQQFARYGQGTSQLQQMQQLVAQLEQLEADYARYKAEAEDATRARDAKWTEAKAWLGILLEVATEALREVPQLLESFQLVEPSPSPPLTTTSLETAVPLNGQSAATTQL